MSTGRISPRIQPYGVQRGCIGNLQSGRFCKLMIRRLINWLKGGTAPEIDSPSQQRRRVSAHAALHARATPSPAREPRTDIGNLRSEFDGRIENIGPGKNVLVRERHVSDDTGTQEMLKLLDDSPLDSDEPVGIDPYNSGEFDRSRHWNTRFRN